MGVKQKSNDKRVARLLENDDFRRGYQLRRKVVQLGEKLRELRTSEFVGLTQQQAADLIGMSQSELSRIENGTGPQGPSYATLLTIIEGYSQVAAEHNARQTIDFAIDMMENGTVR